MRSRDWFIVWAVIASALFQTLWLLQAGAALARPEAYALLLGIDTYASPRRHPLLAAVADVRDFEGVLGKRGVHVVSLVNHEATLSAFDAAWAGLAAKARPGDTIVVTFSGHGIKEPELSPVRHSVDGFNNGFILYPYDEAKQPNEILRTEYLYDLFQAQSRRGVKILFIADACHAGPGVRGVPDARAPARAVRFETYDVQAAPPPPPPPLSTYRPRPLPKGVVILSATDENSTILEATINGAQRGALSWAVARGLEGPVDAQHGGVITARELWNFVAPQLREATATAKPQTPQLRALDVSEVLFDFATSEAPGQPDGVTSALPPLQDVALAQVGERVDAAPVVPGAVAGSNTATASLLWDKGRNQLLDTTGDVIASGIDEPALARAVAGRQVKVALINAMLARGKPLETSVESDAYAGSPSSDKALFAAGERVAFTLKEPDTPHITAFDIVGDGTIQFLWPDAVSGASPETPTGGPLRFTAPVSAPYGLDTVVFISTARPLPDLHKAIRDIQDRKGDALALYRALQAGLAGVAFNIGMQSEFTCAIIRENGLCDTNVSSVP